MFKAFVLFSILFANTLSTAHVEKPGEVLQNLFNQSIAALDAAKSTDSDNRNINDIIHNIILPNINVARGTQFALKKHWQDINEADRQKVQTYIVNSLISDYGTFLLNYKDFNQLKIIIKDDITLQDNRALINITLLENGAPIDISIAFKMIAEEAQWKIYDLIISGVSLMKSFQSSFNSTIRRKGLAYFINSLTS